MGQDGLNGCHCIREAGGRVIVQDEASSVVWGMPGAVCQAGLAEKVLPLSELAAEINRRVDSAFAKPGLDVLHGGHPEVPAERAR
jgi:two-component system chemotaxis response regulator CheB